MKEPPYYLQQYGEYAVDIFNKGTAKVSKETAELRLNIETLKCQIDINHNIPHNAKGSKVLRANLELMSMLDNLKRKLKALQMIQKNPSGIKKTVKAWTKHIESAYRVGTSDGWTTAHRIPYPN